MTSVSPSLRHDQAIAVRERLLSAALLVVETGAEPTMRAVAAAANVAERTVYRYFSTREALHAALLPLLAARVSAPMADEVHGLEAYVRRLYTQFDDNERLARALSRAAWMPTVHTRSTNLRALRGVIDGAFPSVPRADRESAAATLRATLSASGWAYLADCGFDGAARIRHARWLTRTILEKLERLERGNHA